MPIIDATGLASYLRDPSVTEESAAVLLDLTNSLVTSIVGDEEAANPHPRVLAITYEVAARAWRNPNGYSSETIDDYTYRRDADTRKAGVYLTAEESTELGGLSAPTPGVFTLDLGTPYPW